MTFIRDGYRLRFGREGIAEISNLVTPTQTLSVIEGANDDRILECAVEARSDAIITHDKDLLRLKEYAGSKSSRQRISSNEGWSGRMRPPWKRKRDESTANGNTGSRRLGSLLIHY